MLNYIELFVAHYSLPNLHLAPPLRVIPFEFRRDLWRKKTKLGYLVALFP